MDREKWLEQRDFKLLDLVHVGGLVGTLVDVLDEQFGMIRLFDGAKTVVLLEKIRKVD